MRYRPWLLFLPGILCLAFIWGCRDSQVSEETAIRSVVPATVTVARNGRMSEYAEFPATSAFLQKAVIKSPITGYVEKCMVSAGDQVPKNSLLFELRTKEASVLPKDSLMLTGVRGLIQVNASINGIVSAMDHPRGDFVQEGESLCSIVLPESLVFILEVPFEMNRYIHKGDECTLLLPDNSRLVATVHSVLPAMTGASQTQKIVLKPGNHGSLPENLLARVRITSLLKNNALILPKSSLLSDEVMKSFWVMKLINDTMAVKVPVSTGISGTDSVEIISPVFSPSDRFMNSGNYGLGDTAIIRIIK